VGNLADILKGGGCFFFRYANLGPVTAAVISSYLEEIVTEIGTAGGQNLPGSNRERLCVPAARLRVFGEVVIG